jgi:hypothetical protein
MRLPAGDPRTEILRLETEIEELTEVIERCRKIILMSKIAVAAGSIWLLALTLGVIRFDPVAMIGAHCRCNRGHRHFWIEYEHSQANCGRRTNCRSTQSRIDR